MVNDFVSMVSGLVNNRVLASNGMVYYCMEGRAVDDYNGVALILVSLSNSRISDFSLYGNQPRGFEVWKFSKRSSSYFDKYGVYFRFPSNEEFGSRAWSFSNHSSAVNKFHEVLGNV